MKILGVAVSMLDKFEAFKPMLVKLGKKVGAYYIVYVCCSSGDSVPSEVERNLHGLEHCIRRDGGHVTRSDVRQRALGFARWGKVLPIVLVCTNQ